MLRSVSREAAARRDLTLIVVVINVGLARLARRTDLARPPACCSRRRSSARSRCSARSTLRKRRRCADRVAHLPAVAAIGCLGAIGLVPISAALGATAFPRGPDAPPRGADRGVGPRVDGRRSLEGPRRDAGWLPSSRSPAPGRWSRGPRRRVRRAGPAAQPAGPRPARGRRRAVPGLLGYRAAALRVATVRDALWSAATCAIAIAIRAAAIRPMEIPRLIGPALRDAPRVLPVGRSTAPRRSRRRDPRWIWQVGLLLGLGALVIGRTCSSAADARPGPREAPRRGRRAARRRARPSAPYAIRQSPTRRAAPLGELNATSRRVGRPIACSRGAASRPRRSFDERSRRC